MLKSTKRRRLTDQEVATATEAETGRKLSKYECSKGMRLIEKPWDEEQLRSMLAKLDHMEAVDQLPMDQRLLAMTEMASHQLDDMREEQMAQTGKLDEVQIGQEEQKGLLADIKERLDLLVENQGRKSVGTASGTTAEIDAEATDNAADVSGTAGIRSVEAEDQAINLAGRAGRAGRTYTLAEAEEHINKARACVAAGRADRAGRTYTLAEAEEHVKKARATMALLAKLDWSKRIDMEEDGLLPALDPSGTPAAAPGTPADRYSPTTAVSTSDENVPADAVATTAVRTTCDKAVGTVATVSTTGVRTTCDKAVGAEFPQWYTGEADDICECEPPKEPHPDLTVEEFYRRDVWSEDIQKLGEPWLRAIRMLVGLPYWYDANRYELCWRTVRVIWNMKKGFNVYDRFLKFVVPMLDDGDKLLEYNDKNNKPTQEELKEVDEDKEFPPWVIQVIEMMDTCDPYVLKGVRVALGLNHIPDAAHADLVNYTHNFIGNVYPALSDTGKRVLERLRALRGTWPWDEEGRENPPSLEGGVGTYSKDSWRKWVCDEPSPTEHLIRVVLKKMGKALREEYGNGCYDQDVLGFASTIVHKSLPTSNEVHAALGNRK